MKKYNTPILRIRTNTPFLSSKWRGNNQTNEINGVK
jgi:hypothetical protein